MTNDTESAQNNEAPVIPHSEPPAGTATLDAAAPGKLNSFQRFLKILGP